MNKKRIVDLSITTMGVALGMVIGHILIEILF